MVSKPNRKVWLWVVGAFIGLMLLSAIISKPGGSPPTANQSSSPAKSIQEPATASASSPSSSPSSASQLRKVCLEKEDQDTAKQSLQMLTGGTTPEVSFHEGNGATKVVFGDAGWAAAPPATNIHMVADLDACIQGIARRLDFYLPDGDHVGYADPG